jgi:hypothetical protein
MGDFFNQQNIQHCFLEWFEEPIKIVKRIIAINVPKSLIVLIGTRKF